MNKYEKPTMIVFDVSPIDIITTSAEVDNDDYEPGTELPEFEFPFG